METMYATVTSKGQITLPAAARRALGLHEGQKLGIRIDGQSLVIDAPPDIDDLRKRARIEAEANDSWGKNPPGGAGWEAHVSADYDEHGRAKS